MMINDHMPEYCVERASKILNRLGSLERVEDIILESHISRILTTTESPAVKVIDGLRKKRRKWFIMTRIYRIPRAWGNMQGEAELSANSSEMRIGRYYHGSYQCRRVRTSTQK